MAISDFKFLKPVFLLYGPDGCGKELLVESVSRYLGLRYISQSCFDWPTNNIPQFKKKIEYFFEDVKSMTPCLLHLENAEVNITCLKIYHTLFIAFYLYIC